MKATGIVRRLDDLGRLVIPKEIRKIYKLKEGDSIEFFVSENKEIIIKKFQHLSEDFKQIENMIESYQELFNNNPLMFYGDDSLIAVHENMFSKQLSSNCIEKIKVYNEQNISNVQLFEMDNTIVNLTVFPLVVDSLWVGSFLVCDYNPSDSMKNVINSYIKLLSRNIEH